MSTAREHRQALRSGEAWLSRVWSSVFVGRRWPRYLASLVILAWSEEWLWDRLVWHERPGLFPGPAVSLWPVIAAVVVPLLALPQATHYILDAWIWRVRRENPDFARMLGVETPAPRHISTLGGGSRLH